MPPPRLLGEEGPASEEGYNRAPLGRFWSIIVLLVARRVTTRCSVWILAVSVRVCVHVEPSIP
jgi:hypothetical protein